MNRPEWHEYPPFFRRYVSAVPDGDVLGWMESGIEETLHLLGPLDERRAAFRYAPGKWTVKEAAAHMADTERILSTRALRFARGDATPVPGFDQDAYAAGLDVSDRPLASVLNELVAVRGSTLALFRTLSQDAARRTGSVDGETLSVRAIAYVIVGHERHHHTVFRERYVLG